MKYLLVILAFVCSMAYAGMPEDAFTGKIMAVGSCDTMTCVLVEKDGTQYIIMGYSDGTNMEVLFIYTIEGQKLRQVWGWNWKKT